MGKPKSKKDTDLSAGALTYCEELAKEIVYGYKPSLCNKYLDKGNICEDLSIELYNDVHFTSHKKNTERKENTWLTGECDIDARDKIIDIKSSWSLETFPATKQQAHKIAYEWQGRAYMMLWDKDLFELAYCLVSTPIELIGYDNDDIHYVDHIDPELRVTTKLYERDEKKEELIKLKCWLAKTEVESIVKQITNERH